MEDLIKTDKDVNLNFLKYLTENFLFPLLKFKIIDIKYTEEAILLSSKILNILRYLEEKKWNINFLRK